jgi:NAD(P)-dependent dehydrogenase (short-subunit alcohol dehydrogenase family)
MVQSALTSSEIDREGNFMAESFAGWTVAVTGASSGMGRAIAVRLAQEGAFVVGCGRSRVELDETARLIKQAGGRFRGVQTDLADPGAGAAFVREANAAHGRLDAVVCNAAVIDVTPIAKGDPASWRRMIAINLISVAEAFQAGIEAMREAKRPGWLIAISSLASRMEGMGMYGASKAGLNSLCQSLRLELEKDPIRVTTIIPGAFATNLGRDMPAETRDRFIQEIVSKGAAAAPDTAGRSAIMGVPDDIARAVSYVLSQPPSLNIPELVIRPQMDLTIPLE